MKKFFAIATSILFLSCSNDDNKIKTENLTEVNQKSNLESLIVTKTTTELFTNLFIAYGVNKIECIQKDERFEYKIKSGNTPTVIFGDDEISLSDSEFILENGKIYKKNNPNLFLTLVDNKIFLNNGLSKNDITQMTYFQKDSMLLLLFLNEITTPNNQKSFIKNISTTMRPCDVNNQTYVTGYGLTQGGAEADLAAGQETLLRNGGLDGCTLLDSKARIEKVSIFITATVSYCCDGHGGSGGSW